MEIDQELDRAVDAKDLENKIKNAKAFLLSSTTTNHLNLYDHLVNIIAKALEKKSVEFIDNIEERSFDEKRSKFTMPPDTIQDKEEVLPATVLAHEHKVLFDRPSVEVPDTLDGEDDANEKALSDLMENSYFFEQASVGLGREETFRVFLALKQLTDAYKLQSCRFWGKILGVENNYFVAEVEFKEGEDPMANERESTPTPLLMDDENKKVESPNLEDREDADIDDVPLPDYKPPPVIPKEDYGVGCNSKVFFVCNEPGQSWSRLPEVTPAQIVVARQIRKLLTGNLEAEVLSYPPFPGNEANYLRCQIARISASTIVSPQGYYMFEEDEEEEDEAEGRDKFIINDEFEGLPISDLIDPSLSGWVHHSAYILPQGRTSWFNPMQKTSEEEAEEEEDEEDEKEEPDEPEPETGPPLLTPLSEDNDVNGMSAWTVVKSSSLVSQYAIAVLHSNLWPGAHAFAVDRKFENIYIGWAQKYSATNYSPPPPPAILDEYPSGPEITEGDDPTVEEERALNAARQEALEAAEEEEESEDGDDDDDD